MAQERNLCELLDISYTIACQKLDPKNKLIFIKNETLFYNHYTIEDTHKTQIYREKRFIPQSKKFFSWFDWSNKLRPGTEILEFPYVYLKNDSIIIMNHISIVLGNGRFAYGPSHFSLFVYDHDRNDWILNKNWIPDLQARISPNLNDLIEECRLKTINEIQKSESHKETKIYLISDYCPYSKNYEDQLVPKGHRLSRFKRKADYIIGYPEIYLCENRLIIKMKFIKSNDIKSYKKSGRYQTSSMQVEL